MYIIAGFNRSTDFNVRWDSVINVEKSSGIFTSKKFMFVGKKEYYGLMPENTLR